VQAAIGSNIFMAVLAVVIMDIKCGIEIDNGAGMTLTALSIGADPGMIRGRMRIKVCGIIWKTVGTVMAGVTGIGGASIMALGRRANLQGVITGTRISVAHTTLVIMDHSYILILVCSACLVVAAGTLGISVYPASSNMIGVVKSIRIMTAYTWVG
jgi:hypothetical protein